MTPRKSCSCPGLAAGSEACRATGRRCTRKAPIGAVAAALAGLAWVYPAPAAEPESAPPRSYNLDPDALICDRVIDGFAGAEPGAFPSEWSAPDDDETRRARSLEMYVVKDVDGRRAIHAQYAQEAITIGRETPEWDLEEYPVLSWEWKVVTLPKDADETQSARNDSAAGVYAIWDVGFPFYVDGIKYAWSTTLAPGTRNDKRFGHDQLLVVEGGEEHAGRWQRVHVNVREHYREFFGEEEAKSPDGIALLTDADATGSQAEAYYADFRLCREPE